MYNEFSELSYLKTPMNNLTIITAALLLVACTQNPSNTSATTPVIKVDEKTLAETRAVAMQLRNQLGAKLAAEMSKNGPASAVGVCNISAPEIAAAISKESGWQVGRVGTRVRNASNQPNVWQQAALASFASNAAKGEKFDNMETHSVATENGKSVLRYAKAIGVQPACLACHGKPENIPADVKAILQEKYPNDQAIGYSVGELRGAVVITRPL